MIHMDIDTHSPRRQRIASVKRARSPEPSSPQDRPPKRLSLNVGHPNPYPSLSIRKRFGDNSAGSSRHSSEDWVQQTGGLTIDSPARMVSFFHGIQKDEDMMVETPDSSIQETITHSGRPQLPLLQTSGYPTSFTANQAPHSVNVPQDQHQLLIPSITTDSSRCTPFQESLPSLAPEDHHTPGSLLGPSPIMGPNISVIPPTPMERQTSQDYQQADSPLVLNSNTSSSVAVAPRSPKAMSSRRQPRFMMGPRADCEKCRLGVKGHFVHLD